MTNHSLLAVIARGLAALPQMEEAMLAVRVKPEPVTALLPTLLEGPEGLVADAHDVKPVLDDEESDATGFYPDYIDPARLEKLPMHIRQKKPMIFGHVPGIRIGKHWALRAQCSADRVHAPFVAGISGSGELGCYSVALSGGYPEDVDNGEWFTYTGEGGRELKGTKSNPKNLRTAPQSKDQELSRGNLALKVSCETRRPVRVIRGYKLPSPYAPEHGYRYDGLYIVTDLWEGKGVTGHLVYRYRFERCQNQPPPPWKMVDGAVKLESVPTGIKKESIKREGEEDEQESEGEEKEAEQVIVKMETSPCSPPRASKRSSAVAVDDGSLQELTPRKSPRLASRVKVEIEVVV